MPVSSSCTRVKMLCCTDEMAADWARLMSMATNHGAEKGAWFVGNSRSSPLRVAGGGREEINLASGGATPGRTGDTGVGDMIWGPGGSMESFRLDGISEGET